jgi:predicted dehydrogenase
VSTVRWGIVGTGAIAAGFADAVRQTEGGVLAAVASRTSESANAFGDRFEVPTRHASYDDLAADADVDVAYIATPQSRHAEDTILQLEGGKHVLCEKPFALDAAQARAMVDAARANGRFLMEAMWTRFLPAYRLLATVLAEGRIGQPLLVEADFGWRREVDPEHRLYRRDLGGGGLLDLGIYPLQLCSLVLGPPESVAAQGVIGSTGVDELVAAVLQHPNEGIGVIKAGLRVGMTCAARIAGTHGVIDIPALMHCPESISVSVLGQVDRLDGSYEGNGLRFEIDEVHRCLADGRLESDVIPLAESVAFAEVLDAIRAQIGLDYERSR